MANMFHLIVLLVNLYNRTDNENKYFVGFYGEKRKCHDEFILWWGKNGRILLCNYVQPTSWDVNVLFKQTHEIKFFSCLFFYFLFWCAKFNFPLFFSLKMWLASACHFVEKIILLKISWRFTSGFNPTVILDLREGNDAMKATEEHRICKN